MTRSFCSGPTGLKCVQSLLLAVSFLYHFAAAAQDIPPRRFSVQIMAAVQESPPRITLSWINEGDANSYAISRRTLTSGWQQIGNVGGGDTSFSDGNVSAGTPYEYQVVKHTGGTYSGYGYLRAGIRVASPDYRGKLLLLVENGPPARSEASWTGSSAT